jgi:hypothetical protein
VKDAEYSSTLQSHFMADIPSVKVDLPRQRLELHNSQNIGLQRN